MTLLGTGSILEMLEGSRMTTNEIADLCVELADFLGEFRGCFGRAETRRKLETYLRGQLSQLPRKSVEPIALDAGIAPRSLQEFLASDVWDEDLLRTLVAQIVTRDHSEGATNSPGALCVVLRR